MRTYEVPFLLDEEPKLVGGKLTLRQGAYVLGGIIVAIGTVDRFAQRSLFLTGFIVLLVAAATLLLAFWRVPGTGMYVDTYLAVLLAYNARTHAYTYSRRREVGTGGVPR